MWSSQIALKNKTNAALPDFLWAKIAHILMQELPEHKHSKLFVFFFPLPAVSEVLKLSRCPTHSLVSSAAIVAVVMIIPAIMRWGCVGITGGWHRGTWLRGGGWVKSEGLEG